MSREKFRKRRWINSLSRDFAGNQFPDLQREIAEWARETFDSPLLETTSKLEDEFLELLDATAYVDNREGIAREAADVLIMLFQLAETYEFDLLEETGKKFEVNKARQWEKQPDGTYQHT